MVHQLERSTPFNDLANCQCQNTIDLEYPTLQENSYPDK